MEFLRNGQVYPYLKFLRKKYFPSPEQREETDRLPQMEIFYSKFLSKGELCFDVGANLGNRTEVFLKLGATVVAVEPQPLRAKMLQLQFGKRIQVIKSALGESEKQGLMYISDSPEISSMSMDWINSVSNSRFKNRRWSKSETVSITTLDKLISTYGVPKFCKIDVEGYEVQVLKGLSNPIPYLSFEYTVPEKFENIEQCFGLLSSLGKFESNYTIGENTDFELSTWSSASIVLNGISRISKEGLFGDIYVHFLKDK